MKVTIIIIIIIIIIMSIIIIIIIMSDKRRPDADDGTISPLQGAKDAAWRCKRGLIKLRIK